MAGGTSKRSPRNQGEGSVNKRVRVVRNSNSSDDEVTLNEMETQNVVPESQSNSDEDFEKEEEEETASEDEITNKKNGKRSKSSKSSTSLSKSSKANGKSTLKRLKRSQPKEKKTSRQKDSQTNLRKNAEEFEESGSSSGVIKSIRLHNFMCHDNFYKEWHPNLNFVTGENGSGKSAILSGLLIGLGAKAMATSSSRTSSIKSLIKVGQTYAKTSITLLNNGSLKEKEYGDELTIERILDVKGTSTYKIKTLGVTRPLRKAELEKILLVLNIELDNPITILNQEAARNFLKTQNPNDKYKLFYQGTLLEKCERILAESVSDHSLSEKNFEVQRNAIQVGKKYLKELEMKAQIVRDMKSYEDKIKGLEAEYHWSVVLVMENKLAKLEQLGESRDQELSKINQNFDKCTKELEDMKTNVPSEEQKQRAHEKLLERRKVYDSIVERYIKVKGSARNINTQHQHKQRKIETNQKQIDKLKNKLEELRLKKANNDNNDDEEKKRGLELELVELQKGFTKFKKEADEYRKAADDAQREVGKYDETRIMLGSMIRSKQKNIEMMNSSQADRYSYLGREMVTLLGLIERNKSKFSKMPKGPVAAFIKIKEPRWAVLVELILSRILLNFIVDNAKDSVLLNELISRVYNNNSREKRPQLNINKFVTKAYDISNGNASLENHPTVFDVITIEDDDIIIKNAIIDYTFAERILLFETNNDAIDIMSKTNRVPRTCKFAYTLEYYKVTPAPNLKFMALNKPIDEKRARYLKTSVQEDTGVLEREIEDIELQMSENNKLIGEKKKQESILRRDSENRQNQARETHRKIKQIENDMETITKRGSAETDDGTDDFLETINDLQNECETQREEQGRFKDRLDDISMEIATNEQDKHNSEVAIDALTRDYKALEERLENANQHIETLVAKIAKLKRKRSDQEEEKKSVLVKIEATKLEVINKITEAEVIKARIPTKKTPENIRKELENINLKLKSATQLIGNTQSIMDELEDTKKKHMAAINHVGFIEQMLLIIGRILDVQKEYFEFSKNNLGNTIGACFSALISSRGYKGRLDICHSAKEIYYYVCPDNESTASTLHTIGTKNEKSVKKYLTEYGLQLSGGERSFSTICFILSLWQVLRSPFFMLDEFDVCMDPLNRKASQIALIMHAQRFGSRQFFLFTPLELSMMPSAEKASVLKMFPPNRNVDTADRATNSEERGNHHPEDEPIVSSPDKLPSRARKVMAENISVRSRKT